jgi:hypothetical protein
MGWLACWISTTPVIVIATTTFWDGWNGPPINSMCTFGHSFRWQDLFGGYVTVDVWSQFQMQERLEGNVTVKA